MYCGLVGESVGKADEQAMSGQNYLEIGSCGERVFELEFHKILLQRHKTQICFVQRHLVIKYKRRSSSFKKRQQTLQPQKSATHATVTRTQNIKVV